MVDGHDRDIEFSKGWEFDFHWKVTLCMSGGSQTWEELVPSHAENSMNALY